MGWLADRRAARRRKYLGRQVDGEVRGLSEVDVQAVGLVRRGANRMPFYFAKDLGLDELVALADGGDVGAQREVARRYAIYQGEQQEQEQEGAMRKETIALLDEINALYSQGKEREAWDVLTRVMERVPVVPKAKAEPKPKADDRWFLYDLSESGPTSEFTQAVRARETMGEDFADAMNASALDKPELLAMHDLWSAALARGSQSAEFSALPVPLQVRATRILEQVAKADAAAGKPAQAAKSADPRAVKFNDLVDQRAEQLRRGGMSDRPALATAQDEVFGERADLADAVK